MLRLAYDAGEQQRGEGGSQRRSAYGRPIPCSDPKLFSNIFSLFDHIRMILNVHDALYLPSRSIYSRAGLVDSVRIRDPKCCCPSPPGLDEHGQVPALAEALATCGIDGGARQ